MIIAVLNIHYLSASVVAFALQSTTNMVSNLYLVK